MYPASGTVYRWGRPAGTIRPVVLSMALCALLAGCGASATPKQASTTTTTQPAQAATAAKASFDGPTLANPAPAPALIGKDYLGYPVDIANYRGKAVLVTFIYTHCPDVCPLITANLHNALALLGPQASRVQVIGVSTDPRGDTPVAVASFLARHGMVRKMEYVVGSRAALTPVWRAWGINASNPTSNDQVNHSALVYGITASGIVRTVYPANFKPSDIVHDVPLLASE